MSILSKEMETSKKSRYKNSKSINSLLLAFLFFILISFGFPLLVRVGIINL